MRRFRYWLILLFSFLALTGQEKKEVLDYEISYLGIPLLDMKLTWVEDDTSVMVSYNNTTKPLINVIVPVHNIYRVHFMKSDYKPLNWAKTVREGNMHFRLSAYRSQNGKQVSYSNGFDLAFPEDGFTVFSATHYLASRAHDENAFPSIISVFIDGELWQVTANRYDSGRPHPDHKVAGDEVLIEAKLSYVGGRPLLEKNDILTDHIAREGSRFLLWVAPDGRYTKAQFGKFPSAVVLRMINN